jgi:hypothetical protein
MHAPIAIGGIGGSGTRVIAAILREAGIDIGAELNSSLDNLWFTFLFKDHDIRDISDHEFRQRVALFRSAMVGGPAPTADDVALIDALSRKERTGFNLEWHGERARSLLAALTERKEPHAWGWKEPNTHIVLDRLAATLPDLRYIHVARNGLDMALSKNQNQPRMWGKLAFGEAVEVTPRQSVKFWCWAHRRVLAMAKELGPRFLFVRFEDLCESPESEIGRLLSFAGIEPDADLVRRATLLVFPPASLGRHKSLDLATIDAADIQYMKQLGFDVALDAGM